MVKEDVKKRLCAALDILNKEDFYLLCEDLHERTIAHKLAEHLQRVFPEYNVDCEYNKNIDSAAMSRNKRLTMLKEKYEELKKKLIVSEDEYIPVSVYPDIIIHERGKNSKNLLVIEMKNSTRIISKTKDFDILKLESFTDQTENGTLKYTYGVFLVLKTGKDYNYHNNFISEEQWFKEGRKINDEEFLCHS